MSDPFRPPLWRRSGVAVVAAFVGVGLFFAVLQQVWYGNAEALKAQTPEIVSATYLGTGAIVERRYQPRDRQAVFVRLEDGSKREFRFSGPASWLEGCKIGEPIRLEQRGLVVSLAKRPCPAPDEGSDK